MADNIITNANDVELILENDGVTRGTEVGIGRIVVDEFTITREEDATLESGVGQHLPEGISRGNVEHTFSFTIMGEDVATFEMIADGDGRSNVFSMTARRREGTDVFWEFALDTCMATSEEMNASSGDTAEYAVDGIARSVDKTGTRSDGSSAWSS